MGQIFLTASQTNGERYYTPGGRPRVVAVDSGSLSIRAGKNTTGQAMVKENLPHGAYNKYKTYENPAEIEAQILMNAGQGTTLLAKNYVALAAAALGATYAASLKLSKTYTEITTATASSADSIGLDAAAAKPVGTVRVIINSSGVALRYWPPTGEKINSLAIDASITIPATTIRIHFVVTAAGVWTVADDYTQI